MAARPRSRGAFGMPVLLAFAAVAVILACGAVPAGLEQQVVEFTRQLAPHGPYRPPEPAERDALVAAVGALVEAGPQAAGAAGRDARRELERAGFAVGTTADEAGNRYLVARSDPGSERSWGLLALPLRAPPRLIIEVPHPNSDYDTEAVGLRVLAIVPDAIFLEAGAHRRAAGRRADVAHHEDSLFHALAVGLSTRLALPQLQLHGFGDRDDLDDDVVLSDGSGDPDPSVRDLAERFRAAGVSVCRAWSRRCRGLEGTTNVQADAAVRAGLPFAHVELSASARSQPARVARILATFAR